MSQPDDALKAHVFNRCLQLGTALINVDGLACTGMPVEQATERQVILRVGFGLKPAMNIITGALGFSCTASFNGVQHDLQIPWSAVHVIAAEDSPKMIAQWEPTEALVNVAPPKPTPRGGLKLVD